MFDFADVDAIPGVVVAVLVDGHDVVDAVATVVVDVDPDGPVVPEHLAKLVPAPVRIVQIGGIDFVDQIPREIVELDHVVVAAGPVCLGRSGGHEGHGDRNQGGCGKEGKFAHCYPL